MQLFRSRRIFEKKSSFLMLFISGLHNSFEILHGHMKSDGKRWKYRWRKCQGIYRLSGSTIPLKTDIPLVSSRRYIHLTIIIHYICTHTIRSIEETTRSKLNIVTCCNNPSILWSPCALPRRSDHTVRSQNVFPNEKNRHRKLHLCNNWMIVGVQFGSESMNRICCPSNV